MVNLSANYYKCVDLLEKFSLLHKSETFYAFAIDSGLLCMNSEEGLLQILDQYAKDWEKNLGDLLTLDNLSAEFLEEVNSSFNIHLKRGRYTKNEFQKYLEDYTKIYNENLLSKKQSGNPYKTEKKRNDIRYQTGDWLYQGFNQLNLSSAESASIIEALILNQKDVFKHFKIANEFKIFLAGHVY